MKILVVSEFIAPLNAIASIRWTKLGKYLARNHDCRVDILTNKKDFASKGLWATRGLYDETLANDLKWFENYYQFEDGFMVKATNAIRNILKDMQDKRRNAACNNADTVTQPSKQNATSLADRIYPIFLKLRERTLVRTALSGKPNWEEYDVIISSFSPKWTHLVAREAKRRIPSILWLADYRDALVYSNATDSVHNREFASVVTGTASCITAVSSRTLHNLFLAPESVETMVLPNGYDSEELSIRERKGSEKFLISYTGTLYSEGDSVRDLHPLFEAISALIENGAMDSEVIEFLYCGTTEELFEAQISSFPLIPYQNLGLVSRSEALAVQDKSSVLALCTWNTPLSQGVITGKIFEYFTSSVPIACLCAGSVPDSKIKEMIRASDTGYCYEEANGSHDLPELKQFVLDKYDQWKETGLTSVDADWSYIESFSYSNLANKLYEKIEDLAKASKAG